MACINIAGTVNDSIVDGEGWRFTIFTQGCPHHCAGCHNPQTQAPDGGKLADTTELLQQILENPLLDGVTFSGGEPFLQAKALALLGRELKDRGLNLTVYTGYTLEELQAMADPAVQALLAVTDVLIDGRFILAERDLTLQFRGSRNQRLIDMPATRSAGHVVLKKISD